MSAPAGETPRPGVRQTRHEVGPAPPITSAPTAIHPRGAAPDGGEHVCHWTAAHHGNVGQRRCRKARSSLRPVGTAQDNKTTNFSRGFLGWFGGGAHRAAREAVGPAVFPAPALHRRSTHYPIWPSGCRQAVHQYQTHGDAHEATRAGKARPGGGRAWTGSAPAPVSELRAPGFHPTARTTDTQTQPLEGDDS